MEQWIYKHSVKLWGVFKGALLGNNMVPIPYKWGLNLKFRAFLYQLHSIFKIFYQERIELNSGVLVDSIGINKIVTIYLTIVLNYYYTINLDKVATN
jgi:hypothetical protein